MSLYNELIARFARAYRRNHEHNMDLIAGMRAYYAPAADEIVLLHCALCEWPLWPSDTQLVLEDGKRMHLACFEVRE